MLRLLSLLHIVHPTCFHAAYRRHVSPEHHARPHRVSLSLFVSSSSNIGRIYAGTAAGAPVAVPPAERSGGGMKSGMYVTPRAMTAPNQQNKNTQKLGSRFPSAELNGRTRKTDVEVARRAVLLGVGALAEPVLDGKDDASPASPPS